jgi:putative redox protein
MNTEVLQVRGLTFIGRSNSGHWVPMDGPADFNGSDSATRSKELLLIGLGGCTGADVASILKKMREKITNFKIDIEAESATEHPKVYTKIHLIYKFWGDDLKEENIKKAIDLSQDRYCSVSAMLKKTVEITYSFEINPD